MRALQVRTGTLTPDSKDSVQLGGSSFITAEHSITALNPKLRPRHEASGTAKCQAEKHRPIFFFTFKYFNLHIIIRHSIGFHMDIFIQV